MRFSRVLSWVVVAGACFGCVGGSKGLSSEDKERLKPYILEAVPAEMQHKLDVNFDIKNVGTLTWDPAWTWTYWRTAVDSSEPANVDLTTNSVGLQSTLGQSVEPGHYIRLGIELTAPDFQGREPIKIETHWAIVGDGARFCTPYSYIEVIQPGMTP